MLGLLLRESTVSETESQSINMKEVSECADFIDTDFIQ